MLKTTGLSVASASSIDNDEFVDGGGAIGWTDASRKSKSKKTKSGI